MRKNRWYLTFICALGWLTNVPASANDFTEYAVAGQQFGLHLTDAARQRTMPRLKDPATASLLATLSDHRRFLEARPFSIAHIGELINMCETANRAGMSYVLFDLERHVNKSMTDPTEIAKVTLAVASRNVVEYQHELTPLLTFHYRCLAKEIPLISAYVAGLKPEELTPIRRAGLAQARRGILSSFISITQAATETAISLSNRREMFAVMVEVASQLSEVLDLPARRQAHDYLQARAGNVTPELAGQYHQIQTALELDSCVGLCLL